MVNYKDFLKRFVFFIKENKVVLVFGLITTLSGFLIIGNIYSNFEYFLNHRYFISFSKTFSDVFTIIKSFFYNNIIQGSSESLTNIFNLNVIYSQLNTTVNIEKANIIFNYFVLFSSIIVFFLVSISSYVIIFIGLKKQSIKTIFSGIKDNLLKLFLLDFIRVVLFSFIFLVVALISYLFKLNSYFYIIISFSISFLVLYVLYFVYQFSIRNILFNNLSVGASIKNAFLMLKNNKKNVLLNSFLAFFMILVFLLSVLIIILPISLLNNYFIGVGYNIFNTVGLIFYVLINLIITTVSNIFIIRFINDIYIECKK